MLDIVSIDRNVLIINALTLGEYHFLSLMNAGLPLSLEDKIICGKINEKYLEDCGFIKITEQGIVLRQKSRELFQNKRDNFYRFIGTFPIKTPKGRYLSPKSLEGVAVNALKKKWKSLFKDNVVTENKVIAVLEAEVAWRIKGGELEYMTGIEAWLNGAFYEKYEYLIEDDKATIESEYHDLM
jgi:hypothetical protein